MAEFLRESYRIIEATELGEWKQLDEEGKQRYALIVSAGQVDMADGSKARSTLWNLFGGNSTTRANLELLLKPADLPSP